MRKLKKQQWLKLLTALGLAGAAVQAGVNTIDFTTDPAASGLYQDVGGGTAPGNGEWRQDGGASGAAGDGYLSITDAVNGQGTCLVFKDLENGLVVASFTFEADVRIGGGTDRPADGFSINYASVTDPLIQAVNGGSTGVYLGWSGTSGEPGRDHGRSGNGLPEEGTATGLAIGFDAWDSGALFPATDGNDMVGISVRVDGNLIAQFPCPLQPGNVQIPGGGAFTYDEVPYRNLPSTDANFAKSLQTGSLNTSGGGESWDNLTWQKIVASVDDSGKVKISWKGIELTPTGGLPTPFTPTAGRLVFGGRTGGANENHHVDNIKLTTSGADKFIIGNASGFAYQYSILFSNSGQSIVNTSTIEVKMNGQVVAGTAVTDQGVVTWKSPLQDPLLASDATITLEIKASDGIGNTKEATRTFKVPVYSSIPAANKLAGNATGDGFNIAMRQVRTRDAEPALSARTWDNNWISVAEAQISGAFGDNIIDEGSSGPGGVFSQVGGTINWDQGGTSQGNFNGNNGYPETNIPGIPGLEAGTDNVTGVVTTYLKLKKGYNRMGVNSDDGFIVSAGPGFDQRGLVLGSFNGGRGASDSIFDFVAPEDGWYPFRLAWWEGGGGANLEWFSQDVATGVKTLINDNTVAGFVQAAPSGATASYVETLNPYPGYTASANDSVKAVLVSGTPAIDAGSIAMKVDGAAVTVTTSGASKITVTYAPTTKFAFLSEHTVDLSYTAGGVARTVSYGFRVRSAGPADFSGNVFVIEAEDFDNGGAQIAGTDTMPLVPGAAQDKPAIRYVDYNHYDEKGTVSEAVPQGSADVYRIGEGVTGPPFVSFNVPMDANQTVSAGTINSPLDLQRPGAGGAYDVATNFKLGWAGESDGQVNWGNYTRTIPQGNYKVWAALSHGEANPNQLQGLLHKVTSGVGTTTQNKTLLGVFNAPGTGGWGHNVLVPMVGVDLKPAVVALGGKTTLRFDYPTGDFDYFFLVPTTDAVTSQLAATPGSFVIEAEDFNTDGGQHIAATDTMPYLGGAYDGKSAVDNVDYHRTDNELSEEATYRKGEVPNVPMNREFDGERDRNRGSYEVTNNWKIGWAGDHWYNYTRTVPNGSYNVYASLSHGDGPSNAGALAGKLELVNDGASTSQQTAQLGTFLAPGTGGWGNSYLVPMMKEGALAAYQISGSQTLRMTVNSGDFDYFVLVPSTAAGEPLPTFGGVTVDPNPPAGLPPSVAGAALQNVVVDAANHKITATVPDIASGYGFITVHGATKIVSVTLEGNTLTIIYQ